MRSQGSQPAVAARDRGAESAYSHPVLFCGELCVNLGKPNLLVSRPEWWQFDANSSNGCGLGCYWCRAPGECKGSSGSVEIEGALRGTSRSSMWDTQKSVISKVFHYSIFCINLYLNEVELEQQD